MSSWIAPLATWTSCGKHLAVYRIEAKTNYVYRMAMNFTGEAQATRQPHMDNDNCSYDLSQVARFETEHIEVQIVNVALNAPTSLAGAIGNLLVLVSIWRTPSLHSPSHVLLFSLALSDLIVGVVVQPLFVIFSLAKIKRLRGLFCSSGFLLSLVGSIVGCVSLMTLTAISIDRCMAIYLHLRYREVATVNRVALLLFSIWFLCICAGITVLWGTTIISYFFPAVVCLSLVFTSVAYCKIYKVVRHHQAHINAHVPHVRAWGEDDLRRNQSMAQIKKSSINMFLVSCLLLLCYTPYLSTAVVMGFKGVDSSILAVHEFTWSCMLINSCLNPFVYFWRLREIRVAVLQTLRRKCRNSSPR